MRRATLLLTAGLVWLTACGQQDSGPAKAATRGGAEHASAADPSCTIIDGSYELPDAVEETSGLAQSRRNPQRLWTHNDAGDEPMLYALDAEGRIVQRVRVDGAVHHDWEDLEMAACGDGQCLYIGDIGDNDADRDRLTIYRIPEPDTADSESAGAAALHAQILDGAADAEGLFALNEDLYVVTKGDRGPVTVYRYPRPQRREQTVGLVRVRTILPEAPSDRDLVTGATTTPDGRWVAIRSQSSLYLYRAVDLVNGTDVIPTVVDLTPLAEEQGESVTITANGTVWLTTEADGGSEARMSRLHCTFPEV